MRLSERFGLTLLLHVTATGNNGSNGLKYPAAHPTVVAVGALSSNYALWGGSNWGSGTELVAPGDLVLSTTVNGRGEYVYSLYSGTSMATPHVAGVAVRSHASAVTEATHVERRTLLSHAASGAGALVESLPKLLERPNTICHGVHRQRPRRFEQR